MIFQQDSNLTRKTKQAFHPGAYYAEKAVAALFFAVICFMALHSFAYPFDFVRYEVSDWLINYQGGFVRRGLVGELLLTLEKIFPYNVRHAILGIEIISYVLFFTVTFRIFIKYRWSLLAAMFPVACVTMSMSCYRRDFMMLCLCALTFYLFFRYLKEKRKPLLAFSVAVMSLSVIVYEPVFFVLVPVLALQYWYACGERKWLKTALVFILPAACMLLSCIYRGNSAQADAIWQSWIPYMTADGYNPADGMGGAVKFLKLTNAEVFRMHLESSFGDNVPLSVATLLIVITFAFFLCTHIPQTDGKNKTLACNVHKSKLGWILLFQLIIQLTLFTVLSIDYGRTLPMSLYTSFFLFHYSAENGVNINVTRPIEAASDKITSLFNRVPLFSNPYFYILAVLVFPFQMFMPSLWRDNIIMHLYDKIVKYVL